jgi:hypothetical protein
MNWNRLKEDMQKNFMLTVNCPHISELTSPALVVMNQLSEGYFRFGKIVTCPHVKPLRA